MVIITNICFNYSLLGNRSQQCLFLCNVFPIRFLATNFNTGTITVTLPKLLCYSTYNVFKSHVNSSQTDFLYTSVLLVPIRSNSSRSLSYVTNDCRSAGLFWNKAPIWGFWPEFYCCQTIADLFMWAALPDERTGLPFTVAAGPRQRSHSLVGVPRDPWSYFTVSDSRPPNLEGQVPIFASPGTGWPSYTSDTEFPLRHLLRLAGLRWRYSNKPTKSMSKLC
jgi:hypothetical protein